MLKFLSKIPLLGRLFGGGAAAAGTAGAKSGLMSKLGLGAAGLAVGDQVLNEGEGLQAVGNKVGQTAEGGLGLWNRYVNTGMNNIEALDRNLTEQSTSMGWFNTINGWLFSLFDFLGMDKMANVFKDRMTNTTEEIFEHIDDQREMLDEHGNYRRERFAGNENELANSPEAPNGSVASPSEATPGEVSLGSAFASAGYGLEKGVVSMLAGLSSLGTGTYEALTTDKGWGAAIADDFNQQNGWAMEKLESLHGKPNVDTPLERGLMYGFEFGSYLIPVAGTAKLAGSVPQALTKFTPALGLAAGPK